MMIYESVKLYFKRNSYVFLDDVIVVYFATLTFEKKYVLKIFPTDMKSELQMNNLNPCLLLY